MLKLRILTALVLGPFIIWSVLTFSHQALAFEFAVFLTLAAWEWARISGLQTQFARIVFALGLAALMGLVSLVLHEYPSWLQQALYIATAWWLLSSVFVLRFRKTPEQLPIAFRRIDICLNLGAGVFILMGAFIAITGMHQQGHYGATYILLLLLLIWIADSAAYFTGKRFGRHKLAPYVSPGKTWEGVAGAVLAIVLYASVAGYLLAFTPREILLFVVIALVTLAFSILGDLIESLFKRRAGVKDSSRLLPGHGGILDRIDSLMAAAPVFLLGLTLAGIQ